MKQIPTLEQIEENILNIGDLNKKTIEELSNLWVMATSISKSYKEKSNEKMSLQAFMLKIEKAKQLIAKETGKRLEEETKEEV